MSNFNISLLVCRGNLFHDDSESEKRHCRGTPGIPASWMAPAKSEEASAGKLPCLSLKDWFCLDAVCPGCYKKQCKKDGVGGDMHQGCSGLPMGSLWLYASVEAPENWEDVSSSQKLHSLLFGKSVYTHLTGGSLRALCHVTLFLRRCE